MVESLILGVMKKFLLVFLFSVFYLAIPSSAKAEISCQPIYGGGQTCITTGGISLNKTVMNPQTNRMVDNLGINDPKYGPDFIVTFQLALTNTSNAVIPQVDVRDSIPQFMNFSAGPGNFEEASKTLTFRVENLNVNETRVFNVLGRVVSANSLPNSSVTCVVNQVSAVTSQGATAQDNAQFCIEKNLITTTNVQNGFTKGGFPVMSPSALTSAPKTGPESLVLFSLVPTAIAGFALRKYSISGKEKN